MDIKSYNEALAAQHSSLSDYIADKISGIIIPASKQNLKVGKSNFLTKSGWVYNVIGILAFIIGLIVGISGIWLTGCAGVVAGCYCLIKGKQQLNQEAYDGLGNDIYESCENISAYVAKTWDDFVIGQNASLRKDLVNSSYDVDKKVAALGFVGNQSVFRVDLNALNKNIKNIEASETLDEYKAYLPQAKQQLVESLDLAVKAQNATYSEVVQTTTGYIEKVDAAAVAKDAAEMAKSSETQSPASPVNNTSPDKTAVADNDSTENTTK